MPSKILRWPKDENIAVMVTVMFEVWSKGKAPPYSPMTTSLKKPASGASCEFSMISKSPRPFA